VGSGFGFAVPDMPSVYGGVWRNESQSICKPLRSIELQEDIVSTAIMELVATQAISVRVERRLFPKSLQAAHACCRRDSSVFSLVVSTVKRTRVLSEIAGCSSGLKTPSSYVATIT